jgi:hypothetical protein
MVAHREAHLRWFICANIPPVTRPCECHNPVTGLPAPMRVLIGLTRGNRQPCCLHGQRIGVRTVPVPVEQVTPDCEVAMINGDQGLLNL